MLHRCASHITPLGTCRGSSQSPGKQADSPYYDIDTLPTPGRQTLEFAGAQAAGVGSDEPPGRQTDQLLITTLMPVCMRVHAKHVFET